MLFLIPIGYLLATILLFPWIDRHFKFSYERGVSGNIEPGTQYTDLMGSSFLILFLWWGLIFIIILQKFLLGIGYLAREIDRLN